MKAGLQVLRGTLATVSTTLMFMSAAWAVGGDHRGGANGNLGTARKLAGDVRAAADKAKAAAVAAKAAQEKKDVAGTEAKANEAKAAYQAAFTAYQEAAAYAGLCDGQARGCEGANGPHHCADLFNGCQGAVNTALAALNEARSAAFEAIKQATRATGGTFTVDVAAGEATGTKGQVAELRTLTEKLAEELKKDSEATVAASAELGKVMDANEEMSPALKKQTAAAIKTFSGLLAQVDKLTNALKRTAIGALDDEDAANVKRLSIAIRATPALVANYKAALEKEGGAAAKFDADLSAAGIGAGADHFKACREGLQKMAQAGDRLLAAVIPVAKPNIAKRVSDTTGKQYTKLVTDAKESLLKVVEFIGKMKDQQSGDDAASDTPPEESSAAAADEPKQATEGATMEEEKPAEEATPAAETTETPAEEKPAEEAADTPPEEPAADAAPAEAEAPADNSSEEKAEAPAEEKPAEEAADTPPEEPAAEDAPAEAPAEKPAEENTEAPADEKAEEPADGKAAEGDTPPEDGEAKSEE